ncbi:MAG: LacI family transcriptional regulator [Firmicutes bacterium]|nr:LacI family transcriptional regulator [Bacillota bacterium]
MSITIQDIADLAKVSKGTVSRVINGAPGVGAETRKRILKLIEELDYQPNASAQSLASRRSYNIGVIIPHTGSYSMSTTYWPALLTAITEKAASQDYNVLLSTARSEQDVDSAYRSILKGKRVDGLIVGAEQFGEKQLAELLLKDFPFVMVGKSTTFSHYYVDVDNVGGARRMTEYLVSLGHRKITMLAGPEILPSVQSRVRGFQEAMTKAQLDPGRVVYTSYQTADAEKSTLQILKEDPPTALFVAAADLVLGVLEAARKLKIKIPDQLALVTFDDHPFYPYLSPSITAVKQPIYELGRAAVEMLFALMGKKETAKQKILPVEIIVRGSSQPDPPLVAQPLPTSG